MLHNRQAPGRDFHKHFSLAPARSDTNPQATRNFRLKVNLKRTAAFEYFELEN